MFLMKNYDGFLLLGVATLFISSKIAFNEIFTFFLKTKLDADDEL